jgi:single-strand DNA-binding protein
MASYNKITIVGNLGSDPQLTVFEQTKVAAFSVAVNESYNDKNGQKVDRTEWFRVGVWGQRAETIMQYLKRGSQIMVEGKLSVRTWQDNTTGKDRFSLEIRASEFVFLGGANPNSQLPPPGAPPTAYGNSQNNPQSSYPTSPRQTQQDPLANNSQFASGSQDNDDLPF